jgi:gluconolactonase
MSPLRYFTAATLILHLVFLSASSLAGDPIAGIGPSGPFQIVHSGLKFTEGPAADAKGELYFTDVGANKVLKANPGGSPTVVLDSAGGMNGLMFDGRGRLIGCQGSERRIVALDIASKQLEVLTDNFDGKPYIRPNDLVVDRQGGVYFTDPKFLGGQDQVSAVYYVSPQGKVTQLFTDLPLPNGILLSPDEQTLYVLPWGAPRLMAYPIQSPGVIGMGRTVCELKQPPGAQSKGGDGMTCDERGNLYLTVPSISSIQVVSSDGKVLGLILCPEPPSNCTFGGPDMKSLYATARAHVYAAPMLVAGHRFGGTP